MENKNKLTPTAVVFFIILAALSICSFVLPKKTYSEREKRYLTEFPEVTAESVVSGGAQDALNDWYADSFPFRDLWVGMNAYLKLLEGRGAQQDVYYCDDGYLINAPEENNIKQLETNLRRFESFANAVDIPASAIIVPQSGYINSGVLPDGHGEYTDGELYETASNALDSVTLYDPTELLKECNKTNNVYYKTDHHLTAFGSFELASWWLENRGAEPLDADEYTVTGYGGFYGTTWSASGYWLTAADTLEVWDHGDSVTVTTDSGEPHDGLYFYDHLDELDKYPVYLDGNHPITKIENPSSDGGTLMIIKDSYAHCFTTFLTPRYSTIYMIDLRYYRGSVSGLVKEYGADELLFLYGMSNLLTDTNSAWLM